MRVVCMYTYVRAAIEVFSVDAYIRRGRVLLRLSVDSRGPIDLIGRGRSREVEVYVFLFMRLLNVIVCRGRRE